MPIRRTGVSAQGMIAESITMQKGLTGAKPEKVCRWILDLLNVRAGDEVVDLYPGTGIMVRVASVVTDEDLALR
jgi:predicted methyltransferase